MAHGKSSFVQRLQAFVGITGATGSQGKAQEAPAATFTANGNVYGESLLAKAWLSYNNLQKMRDANDRFRREYAEMWRHEEEHSFFSFVPNFRDIPVEVFVCETGRIKQPYERGIAYEFCKLDHWYNPSCRPGIISAIMPENKPQVYAKRPTFVVLFAEEQYIELQPEPRIITDERTLRLCDLHFEKRGFDYLDDTQGEANFDLFDFQKDVINGINGPRTKTVSPGGYRQNGRSLPDFKITSGGHAVHNPGYYTNQSPAPAISWGDSPDWSFTEKIVTTIIR